MKPFLCAAAGVADRLSAPFTEFLGDASEFLGEWLSTANVEVSHIIALSALSVALAASAFSANLSVELKRAKLLRKNELDARASTIVRIQRLTRAFMLAGGIAIVAALVAVFVNALNDPNNQDEPQLGAAFVLVLASFGVITISYILYLWRMYLVDPMFRREAIIAGEGEE